MLQHPRSLPDGQPDVRRCLTGVTKISCALRRLLPAYSRGIDAVAIPAPRFDLVEVAVICIERVVGLLVGPIAHDRLGSFWRPKVGRGSFI